VGSDWVVGGIGRRRDVNFKRVYAHGENVMQIMINDYTNGFSITAYDPKDGYLIREVTETKLEALKALHNVVLDLLSKEREAILNAAMMQ